MSSPRTPMTSPTPAKMETPIASVFGMCATDMAASPDPSLVMLTARLMRIVPYSPGVSTPISPPARVLLEAPRDVLHGPAMEHGVLSLPLCDTQVRLTPWVAEAGAPASKHPMITVVVPKAAVLRCMLRASICRVLGQPAGPNLLLRKGLGRRAVGAVLVDVVVAVG